MPWLRQAIVAVAVCAVVGAAPTLADDPAPPGRIRDFEFVKWLPLEIGGARHRVAVYRSMRLANLLGIDDDLFGNDLGAAFLDTEFVLLPPHGLATDQFLFGSGPTEPGKREGEVQIRAEVARFLVARTELTQRAFFADVTGLTPRPAYRPRFRPLAPVAWLSYLACQAFAQRFGMRLPNRYEWQYACRAKSDTIYSVGDQLRGTDANFRFDPPIMRVHDPVPVASFASNRFGLFDMHGNVEEWCVSEGGPIKCGGSFTHKAHQCRAASWRPDDEHSAYPWCGVRLVASVPALP